MSKLRLYQIFLVQFFDIYLEYLDVPNSSY